MKPNNLLSLILIMITQTISIPAFAVETTYIDSKISHVTVYPDSAMITRVATFSLIAGDNSIALNNLPLNLREDSLRVAGKSSAKIQLGSVELQQKIDKELVQKKERELHQKIESLEDEQKSLQDSIEENKDQLNYIRAMASPSKTTKSENNSQYLQLPIEQWTVAWETLATATASTHAKIRVAEKQIKILHKTIQQRQAQLRQIATQQQSTRIATLNIKAETATELELSLRYQIHGARWKPLYDVDLNTQSGKMKLASLAQISQRTGEDWDNVTLTLSTLRPSASSQLHQLSPWTIDFMPEMIQHSRASAHSFSKKSRIESDDEVAGADFAMPRPVPVARMMATKQAMQSAESAPVIADFSAEYNVPHTISLASGSDQRRVTLQTQFLATTISLASVPRFDPRVLLMAKTHYKGDTPLLAGAVALHRDGNFVGNTALAMHQSGEEMTLAFGEDDQVKINFTPDPDKKGKDGLLFGKRKTITRNYHFTVTNQHNKSYNIRFSDRIPVAINEEIKVTLKGDKPTRINDDDKKGISLWERRLEPKQTITLEYGYEVTYPEERQLNGL
ncbi:MAG: mucoidy inhibitor MuiA family protein [Cocleimonas sp.]|nr:mucoidy inhibitor MuiA family protein [Cocleimonas sp.]